MTTDFSGFGLPPKLLQSLARMQFQSPTPIQEQAIPLALAGRDILGSAQTGTGKTGAFGIPLIAHLMNKPDTAVLILTPTRELATQVMATMQQFMPVPEIKTALLIGGEPMPKQFRQIQAHPRVIVGTPGRINDHLTRNKRLLEKVRYLVLDETDRMLDMGFGSQIDKIVAQLPAGPRQTLLFSATLPQGIVKLSSKYLNNPERIQVGSTIIAAPNIDQKVVQMSDDEKNGHLIKVLSEATGSTIIFVKTKYGTERLAKRLAQQDYTADVPHIETVINYDLPQCPEDFIHRIGRTARAGASGQAISFVTPGEQDKWRAIRKLMNPNEVFAKEPISHGKNQKPKANKSSWANKRRSFKGPRKSSDARAA